MILTTDDHVIRVLASQVEDAVLLRRRQAERDDFVALLLAFGDDEFAPTQVGPPAGTAPSGMGAGGGTPLAA